MAGSWRIRHKLMFGVGMVVAIMILMLAGTLLGLASYRTTMRSIDTKLLEVKQAHKLRAAVKALADHQSDSITAELHEKTRLAQEALANYKYSLRHTVLLHRDLDDGFQESEQVKALEKQFAILKEAIKAAQKPKKTGILGMQAQPTPEDAGFAKAVQDLLQTANDLNDVIYGELNNRIRKSKRTYKISLVIVLTTTGVGVFLMVCLLRFFYRWVFYPIRDLQQGVNQVAQGDFEHQIKVESGDEIEDLAKAYNAMTNRLDEMYRDLERQVNERSKQLVRSEQLAGVGFLAAGVAHEINNPLASIAFCSEALERRLESVLAEKVGTGDEQVVIAKYLKMIQDEAFRCKAITQRLLEFSRGGERRRDPTEMGELVQGVLDVVQHLQNCRGKELRFHLEDELIAPVNAQEIKSVVLNLAVNSLDSMDEDGILTITQRRRDRMVELIFEDTGCGMTEEILENIFEPFFTRSRTGKGTGLGLSISHRIISQHGGEIEAVSDGLGEGSRFTVRLPLQFAEEKERPSTAREESTLRRAA